MIGEQRRLPCPQDLDDRAVDRAVLWQRAVLLRQVIGPDVWQDREIQRHRAVAGVRAVEHELVLLHAQADRGFLVDAGHHHKFRGIDRELLLHARCGGQHGRDRPRAARRPLFHVVEIDRVELGALGQHLGQPRRRREDLRKILRVVRQIELRHLVEKRIDRPEYHRRGERAEVGRAEHHEALELGHPVVDRRPGHKAPHAVRDQKDFVGRIGIHLRRKLPPELRNTQAPVERMEIGVEALVLQKKLELEVGRLVHVDRLDVERTGQLQVLEAPAQDVEEVHPDRVRAPVPLHAREHRSQDSGQDEHPRPAARAPARRPCRELAQLLILGFTEVRLKRLRVVPGEQGVLDLPAGQAPLGFAARGHAQRHCG